MNHSVYWWNDWFWLNQYQISFQRDKVETLFLVQLFTDWFIVVSVFYNHPNRVGHAELERRMQDLDLPPLSKYKTGYSAGWDSLCVSVHQVQNVMTTSVRLSLCGRSKKTDIDNQHNHVVVLLLMGNTFLFRGHSRDNHTLMSDMIISRDIFKWAQESFTYRTGALIVFTRTIGHFKLRQMTASSLAFLTSFPKQREKTNNSSMVRKVRIERVYIETATPHLLKPYDGGRRAQPQQQPPKGAHKEQQQRLPITCTRITAATAAKRST
jgi:hypothetical protein